MALLVAASLVALSSLARETGEEAQGGLVVNEIMVANIDRYVDPSWNYGAWVELYNPGATDVQLQGFWISDNPGQPKKARIKHELTVPAGGFALLWFDHSDKYAPTQMPFKLDADGGSLLLSQPDGTLVCQVDFPPCVPRASYGRTEDGGSQWAWSSTPTPGTSNAGMTFCQARLDAPVVSAPSQIFSGELDVRVEIPEGCTLRYTTDGRTPSPSVGQTSTDGLFRISDNQVFRFALFRPGWLSSPVVTRSYLLRDKDFSLPVISVATDPDNLYSDELGIFVRGVNGRPGNHQSMACNWNMDWDRPCNFEYLDAEGHSLVNQETEMKRCGAASRAWAPYSFKIHATKTCEFRNRLDYPFFPAKPYLRHKTLQIRNGGNDFECRVMDPFLQQIVGSSGLDVDYQEYQPVGHYINGVYRGVINMREPSNKHHVYANYGWDEEEIDLFEMSADSGYIQQCGTNVAWKRLLNLSRLSSLSRNYEEIRQLLDIDEFCNYMAVVFFVGCTDWPNNNIKAFRPSYEGGRFRFILYDLDWSFRTDSPFEQFVNKKIYTFNTLYGEPVKNITQEIEVVTLFLNLLRNADFRRQFVDAFCLVAGSVFEPARCDSIITGLAERVCDMQLLPDGGYNTNVSPWGTANQMIQALGDERRQAMLRALKDFPNAMLADAEGRSVTLDANIGCARLLVNGQTVPTGRFSGTLFPPVTLRAQAPAGYIFQGWRLQGDDAMQHDTLIGKGSAWYYYNQASLDGENWRQLIYSTTTWAHGPSPLARGSHYSPATTPDAPAGNTCYFRQRFTISTPIADDASFWLDVEADDGAIVYVNGTEAARCNMPEGSVFFSTKSLSEVGKTPLSERVQLSPSLFRRGSNMIAVELHDAGNRDDLYWDCRLTMSTPTAEPAYLSREAKFTLPDGSAPVALTACFASAGSTATSLLPPVVINEVSASNSIYANEYAKKADWIELYNTTDRDIDLAGMFLTDDASRPQKCRIQASEGVSTILPAAGHRIVWCDGRESLGQLHANFKLENADSALVILTAADTSWADTLVYCLHNGTETVGRFPDGGTDVYRLSRPTIGKPNALTSYSRPCLPDAEGNAILPIRASSAHLSLLYCQGALEVKNEELAPLRLCIATLSGTEVLMRSWHPASVHERIPLPSLPPGTYVASLSDHQGNRCAVKFTNIQ